MTLFEEIYKGLHEPEGPDAEGNHLAWCPFHPDGQGQPPHKKNLSVHPEKGFYCFACGEKGGLKKLAVRFGIALPTSTVETAGCEAVYRYEDEKGHLLFEVVRYYDKDGKKQFYQRRPDGRGGFVKNLQGVRRVLYRLPELLNRSAEPVYIVEGEKDADRLGTLGLLATTNSGGAGKWRKEYGEVLKDRDVIILGDNDEPGRKHVELVERSLKGVARSIKVVRLPDLPEGGDASDWLENGGSREKLAELVALAEAPGDDGTAEAEEFVILDAAPEVISRPLVLIGGHGYASTYVHDAKGHRALIVVRDDGMFFSNARIAGVKAFDKLGVLLSMHDLIPDSRAWSGAGVKRFIAGDRPQFAVVFAQLVEVIDHFMDFDRSLAPQRTMCELVALFIISTYLLDAFFVIGYLWPNGEWGCGKTRLLEVIVEAAYIGCLILNSSTLPTLRDLADYGATLAFDDAEGIMDPKRADPDKRAFLLAGNRKGSTISIKEQVDHGWKTRHYRTFCPRLFSAIRLPDDVLASRTITIPLVKSAQKEKTDRNPQDHTAWPHDRRRLVDDLWALGLANLSRLRDHDAAAVKKSGLAGRNLEPWRSILAVARCLETEHGVAGIFERMEELSRSYQKERITIDRPDPARLAVQCLAEMARMESAEEWVFTTKVLTDRINELAIQLELAPEDSTDSGEKKTYTNATRVGRLLGKLRFERPDSRDSSARGWKTRKADIEKLCLTHGIPSPWEKKIPEAGVDDQAPVDLTGLTRLAGVTGAGETPPDLEAPADPGQAGLKPHQEGTEVTREPVRPDTRVTPVRIANSGVLKGVTGVTGVTGAGEAPPLLEGSSGPTPTSLPPSGAGEGGTREPVRPVKRVTPVKRTNTADLTGLTRDGEVTPSSTHAEAALHEAEEYRRRRRSLSPTRKPGQLRDQDPGWIADPDEEARE